MVEDNEATDASGGPPAPPPPPWPIVGKSSPYYDQSRRARLKESRRRGSQRLATADPTNTDWQRHLIVSHNKLGDLARAAGDLTAAGEHYTAALTIRERLATADPTNTDWQRDPGEFLDSLRFDLKAAEVFVFTPKGDVVSLPVGASPVDFAYAVHTEVGHRCIGARVNGRLVPLGSSLDNADVVEIFTSKAPNAGPSRDWLTYVKSRRARRRIRHWFAKDSPRH